MLLNFKHIFLYYAPALVFGFLADYVGREGAASARRLVLLALSVLAPCLLSFGPFLAAGKPD